MPDQFRQNLLEGSLNGAAFLVQKHTHSIGRRTANFSFIGLDKPENLDLGRKQRVWSLDVFVLEPGYFNKRDDLIEAIEAEGVKVLVHPYLGEILVHTPDGSVTEDEQEGGIARISFTAVEAEEESETLFIVLDSSPSKAADFVVAQAQKDFVDALDEPISFREAFIGGIRNTTSALRKAKARITNSLGVLDDLDGALDDLNSAVASLLSTPSQLAGKLIEIILGVMRLAKQVVSVIPQPGSSPPRPPASRSEIVIDEGRNVSTSDTDAPDSPFQTEARKLQAKQHAALSALVQATVAAGVAEVLTEVVYESASEAVTARNAFTALVEGVEPGSDVLFESLETLSSSVSTRLSDVIATLPDVETVVLAASVPAVVLAFDLYQDAERSAELVNRNGGAARNPLALAANVDLETLGE